MKKGYVPGPGEFESWLGDFLKKQIDFQESLNVVRNNSEGRIWLIGGSVYRALLFGDYSQSKDFDFVVDRASSEEELFVPAKYWPRINRFGSVNLVAPDRNIDLIELGRILQITKKGLEPRIENFVFNTPLNIQSISYEVGSGKLIGRGIEAIRERTIRINDLEMANEMARMYGKSIEELMKKKAMELDFDFVM